MTVIDHPREVYGLMVEHWVDEEALNQPIVDWTGPRPIPDRVGVNNPDRDTTRWEWDTDLSVEDEALFNKYVSMAIKNRTEAEEDLLVPQIDILQQYRNSTPPTTDAQKDAAIRAIIEYLIIDRREE